MKRFLVLLVIGGVALGSWYALEYRVRMPEATLANVPNGAAAVMMVKVPELLNSTLYRELVVHGGHDTGLTRLRERCGFDPLAQFRRVVVFASGFEREHLDHMGFAADGPFEHEALAECVKQAVVDEGGQAMRRVEIEGMPAVAPAEGDSRLAFLGSEGMAGGSEATVRQIIQTVRGDRESALSDPELARLWEKIASGQDAVLVARVPEHWQDVLQHRLGRLASGLLGELAGLQSFAAGVRVQRGLGFAIVLNVGDFASATQLVAALEARMLPLLQNPLISMSPAGPALRRVHIQAQLQDVMIAADIREDRLVQLIALGRGMYQGIMPTMFGGGAPFPPGQAPSRQPAAPTPPAQP